MDHLSDKQLIMLVAPSAMGKSTILDEVVHQNPAYSRVRSFTTRAQRPNDEPNQYFYLTEEEINAREAVGEIITRTAPTPAGDTYGTIAESYSTEICLLDTLSYSVEQYRDLDFASTTTITLIAPYEQWRNQFRSRYNSPSDEAIKRLEEAHNSIAWSLGDRVTKWLINEGTPEQVAQHLTNISEWSDPERGRQMAKDILGHLLIGDIWL